jgi:putative chitinase
MWFWKTKGLNELADKDAFLIITKRINGGTNGLLDRQKYLNRAKKAITV